MATNNSINNANIASNNTFLGLTTGNTTLSGSNNTAVGFGAGVAATTASNMVAIGYQAAAAVTTLSAGTVVGHLAGTALTGSSSGFNTIVGQSCVLSATTGVQRNSVFGEGTATGWTTNATDNIYIGGNITNASESNVLRIGVGTGTSSYQINSAFISGITGITVTGTAVLVSSTNQLGVAVSSQRYKDEIEDMRDYSAKIMKLRPVTFKYTVGEDRSLQSGLIAEEVAQIMPNLVVNDKDGLPQTVKYHDIAVLLLNEIQRLNKRVAYLEEKYV
jgi:trimeric autotransporter adhesin